MRTKVEKGGGSLVISFGPYSGFYFDEDRLHLGWLAIAWLPCELRYLIDGFVKKIEFMEHDAKLADSQFWLGMRTHKTCRGQGCADCYHTGIEGPKVDQQMKELEQLANDH